MPPQRSLKYRERILLVKSIESLGNEMSPYSYYSHHDRKCIVSEPSSRCSECVCHSGSCDVQGPSTSDLESMLHEMEHLNAKDEAAMAKILRLRKQKKFLQSQAKDMLKRGLKTLDELDEAENKEKEE
jgi:hypothetical protein